MTTTIQEFDFSVDLLQAILWQYNEATNLQAILQENQDFYNIQQTQFWTNWIGDVFDLRTANDFGCAVWSIILGLPTTIPVSADAADGDSWGFEGFRKNFDNGNFSAGAENFIQLSIEQKRTVLRMRYFQLTSRGTVPEFNRFLREIFGPGVYILDGLDMTGEIIFQTEPSAQTKLILKYYDILPRPAGVLLNWSVLTQDAWGFEQYRVNFEHGNFKG